MFEKKQPAEKAKPFVSFDAEAAITSVSEDLLGRKAFAESIAKVLGEWTSQHSLVVALRGSWGSGKSSLKNMIVEILQTPPKTAPKVLQFNPWQYDEAATISDAFYREIGKAIGKTKDPLEDWVLKRKLRQYSALLTGAVSPLKAASEKVTGIFGWTAAIGLAAAGLSQVFPEGWIKWAASILMVGSGTCWLIGKGLSLYAGTDRPDKPIRVARMELEKHLRKMDRPLVVVIDDIDRLDEEAIRLIFRHVKINGDLPNISYLLLFQRNIVEDALNAISGGAGRDYLEKIVQATFEIPAVEFARIEKILIDGLNRIFSDKLISENGFDQNRWNNVFHSGMRAYFRTLRDVHRYLSSLSVQAKLHEGTSTFEVNVIDLMAIECIRLFEPDLYDAIAQNKALLAGQLGGDDAARTRIRALLLTVREDRREVVTQFFRELFPTAQWAFPGGGSYSGEYLGIWAREKRVCARRMFDRYFSLRLPDFTVSESEFANFLVNSGDRPALDEAFASLKARNLLPTMLERIDEARGSLPIENFGTLAPAIIDTADQFDNSAPLSGSSPYVASWRSVYWYLMQVPDREQRGRLFLTAMDNSVGLSVPKTLISNERDRDGREPRPPERSILTPEQLQQAQAAWVAKLEASITNPNRILDHPQFLAYLYRWQEFTDPATATAWFRDVTSEPSGLVTMLKHFESTIITHTLGDYVPQSVVRLSLRDLRNFFDLTALLGRLEAIGEMDSPTPIKEAAAGYRSSLIAQLDEVAADDAQRRAMEEADLSDVDDEDPDDENDESGTGQ